MRTRLWARPLEESKTQISTHPARLAGRFDRDDNLGVSLSTILSTVEGGHPKGVNALMLRIQRLRVLNVT